MHQTDGVYKKRPVYPAFIYSYVNNLTAVQN